ncbi:MAG: T9SS type A sorting domain-containing protein [Bacteroidales bacterium]|nr:T9SS type A sorting domain-containing protein [Bacteroidales bacterium]
MKKINRIFFQILALAIVLSSAVSNAFAQGSMCINAYMLKEESCSPGHDGIATVFIPTALSGKCTIEWNLGGGQTSSSEMVNGLSKGTYNVTVRSNTCPGVVFYNGSVNITKSEECDVKVHISGPTSVTGNCNEIPPVTFTATASGGTPPYTFSGWNQISANMATKTLHPGEGHFSVVCIVTDAEGNHGWADLDGYAKKMECAQDPNEIKGPAGYDEERHFVNKSDKMNYTIDFENDPEFAMAPASRVQITYDVPDQQRLASFRLADFGFGDFVFTVPSNVSSYSQRLDVSDSLGVWVDVNAGIDIVNNQVFWIFQSIDPATGAEPVSSQMGFLPINDSLEHGQGYVSFYINPESTVQTGDTVGAEALIVFDDNAPIGTNVWTNTFDVTAPTSILHAEMNALDSLYCTFSFEAQDDPNGSGVQGVEVYVSANNADYFTIGSAHPDSTLSFVLENGVFYQFMSIATDNVGNKEPFKAQPDTAINYNTAPIDLVLNGNSFYEYDPINSMIGTLYTLDNDVNLPFVYELVAGEGDDDNSLFTIEGNTLRTNANFVCSHQTEYAVRVRTTDIGGLYFEKSFTLNEVIQHVTPITRLNKEICDGSSIDFYGRELTEAGTYTDTLTTAEGCDSVIIWYLKVNPSYVVNLDTTVCDQFVWNDSTYTQSGLISHTYILATGCDSTVNYNLTVNHSTTGVDELVACDSLTWIDGITYYESTSIPTYTYVGGNAVGCDSVVTLNLTINNSTTGVDELTVCDSLTWIDGITYYESTSTPTFTLTNAANCDSVVTLHLTVKYSTASVDEQVACDSLTWIDGITYYESTSTPTYTYFNGNAVGCDSTVTLHLTVNYSTAGIDELVACDSLTWIDGITYYESTSTPTYTYVGGNAVGCDSVVTLHLTINNSTTGVDELTACDSLTWIDGVTYYESTSTPTFTLTNAANCDSVVILNLIINHSTTGVDELVACDSLTWIDGITYYESTSTPTFTLTNAANCDSVVTLHLTVNNTAYGDTEVVVCDSYSWYEYVEITESGDYAHRFNNPAGCDSVAILHLTVNHSTAGVDELVACDSLIWIDGVTYYQSTSTPTYTYVGGNAVGCDSTVTLNLTINYSTTGVDELVACDSLTWIDGITYYESTSTPTFTLTNAANCDSVVTLNLTINHSTTGIDELVACDSLTWIDGVTYYESTSTPTYTYVNGNAAGCDSTVTLHLTVNYTVYGETEVVVCDSYDWYEYEGISESGDYMHRFSNPAGCDSVAILHLTVNYGTHNVYDTVVCESYDWNGSTYTQTGTYTYEYTNNEGCTSVDTLRLTVNYGTHNVYDTVVCESYDWNGSTYTQTGTYTYEYTNNDGCTSVDTLHLTVNYGTHNVYDTVVCESYDWNGSTYTQTGTYTYEYTNNEGCASVDTLHLTVNYGTHNVYDTVVCEGYDWNGSTYTQTGTYTYEYTNNEGCSSVDTLHLTVNYGTHNVYDTVVCESYDWNGSTYTQTGTYTYEYTNNEGCTSVDTLHLAVNYGTTGIDEQVACESYTWIDGVTYTASTTTPTFTLTNAAGCDSVVTLHLTIHHGSHSVIDTAVCGSFVWNGETYTQSGTYTYEYSGTTGCANTETLHLTVNQPTAGIDEQEACDSLTWIDGITYYESTNTPTFTLTNAAGCDSVVTLNLSLNHSVTVDYYLTISDDDLPYTFGDTTFLPGTVQSGDYTVVLETADGCDSVVTLHLTVTGIEDYLMNVAMNVYPNPTNDKVNVQLSVNNAVLTPKAEIQLYDMYGKWLKTWKVTGETTVIDLSPYAASVYFIKAIDGQRTIGVRKVVKE